MTLEEYRELLDEVRAFMSVYESKESDEVRRGFIVLHAVLKSAGVDEDVRDEVQKLYADALESKYSQAYVEGWDHNAALGGE